MEQNRLRKTTIFKPAAGTYIKDSGFRFSRFALGSNCFGSFLHYPASDSKMTTTTVHAPLKAVSPSPLGERQSPVTMGLLWVTMVTSFPTVLIGFEWHRQGFSLLQIVLCAILGSTLLLFYAVPASMLGAKTGKTFGELSSLVFGKHGSHLATFHVFWIFSLFYGMTALFMADAFNGLFHPPVSMPLLAFCFALLMCLNNFWGFSGVVNFARFVAAPCLILWMIITFGRITLGMTATPLAAIICGGNWSMAVTVVTTFIIGFAVWGNEADYWRHGRPSLVGTVWPMAVALLIGEVIFPATGWMVAHVFSITDPKLATDFLNKFSFGGLSVLACLVIGSTYFACQDSNIYGVVSAVDSFVKIPKKVVVLCYALFGAGIAAWLSMSGLVSALEAVTSLNAVFLPTATVLLVCEWFLSRYLPDDKSHLHHTAPRASFRWPAAVALLAGYAVGVLTSGLLPGLSAFHVGVPCLFAWFTAAAIYLPLRLLRECLEIT